MTERFIPEFSRSSLNIKSSVIREMMKLTDDPQMISFAGGLPGPEAFPLEELKDIFSKIIQRNGRNVLQYSKTDGYTPLRDAITTLMNSSYSTSVNRENILITSGSQQALYLIGKIMLDPGDVVIVEKPTFSGALITFRSFLADIISVAVDDGGMIMSELENTLSELKRKNRIPKLIYTIPSIHNPTGVTMDVSRRKKLYDIASRFNVLIVEDDPYGMLRYDDLIVPAVKHFDVDERVVYLGSFSKTVAPGLRIGWMAAQPEIIKKALAVKQGEDVCSSTLAQYVIYELIASGILMQRVDIIRQIYTDKRDYMLHNIDRNIPQSVYRKPDGGLFVWLKLPEAYDTKKMLEKALKKNVAYVSGNEFYLDGGGASEMRLNFSYVSLNDIKTGVERLGEVISGEL